MEIKAVKFRKDGFCTQPFVMGGEDAPGTYDQNIRYRGSLQNYLIDTGDEVILVDTGLPAGTPEKVPDEKSFGFTGKDICSYMDAFRALGYKPEQVTKILLTHKHSDHSGEIRSFPNAKIYVNADEIAADTVQVSDYSRYNWKMFDGEAKQRRHDAVFAGLLDEARAIGKEMAEA